jgi:hypothetical protein
MVFNANWKYRIVGSITTQQDVVNAINAAQIPKNVNFTNTPNMPIKYISWDNQNWPWPNVDWGIVIADSNTIPGIKYGGGAMGKNCSVARWYWEDSLSVGLRIWHEISHCMGLNVDMLNWQTPGNDCNRFCTYINSDIRWKNNSEIKNYCASKSNSYMSNVVLGAYYTMVWEQAGFSSPPILPPVVPPIPPTPPAPLPPVVANRSLTLILVNNYVQNKPATNVKVIITSSSGYVSGISNQSGRVTMLVPCGIPLVITTTTPVVGTKGKFPTQGVSCNSGTYSLMLPVGM